MDCFSTLLSAVRVFSLGLSDLTLIPPPQSKLILGNRKNEEKYEKEGWMFPQPHSKATLLHFFVLHDPYTLLLFFMPGTIIGIK